MKNTIFSRLLCVVICLMCIQSVYAEVPEWEKKTKARNIKADGAAQCNRAQGSAEMGINNVRARINTGGTMWYDGRSAYYYVPSAGNSTSIFCGALWIGGQDENKQLRVAAMRFGQVGSDFWPGPLTVDGTATVDLSVCNEWDRLYRINKQEVLDFVNSYDPITKQIDPTKLTQSIKEYPAHGTGNQSRYLAPFFDRDNDGEYNPERGDYPYYDFDNALCPQTLKAALKPGEKYTPAKTTEEINGTGGRPITNSLLVDQVLKGDETLWWIINDKGNAHTESKSENPIGLEIRAQSFAFTTNDEINNMTFCSYEIINRSTYTLTEAYFSQWLDPDLGFSRDDFVGCDVERGLGYCYNGKSVDGPGTGAYAGNPPAVGIDFFQGPYMDPDGRDNPKVDMVKMKANYPNELAGFALRKASGGDSLDVNGNVIYDTVQLSARAQYKFQSAWYFTPGDSIGNCAINGVNFGNGIMDDERFGMRRFVYYNNSTDNTVGEPARATDYYNYLRGLWRTGRKMTYGGNGAGTGLGTTTTNCDFMFPANTDIWKWGTNGVDPMYQDPRGWTEEASNNAPEDRRFMQSAGPFTLKPGAVNYITIGIPWAQAPSGGPYASVELLRKVDDKCQALFDNCFTILEGPEAPTMVAQELSRQVVLYLTYKDKTSNNFGEQYSQIDVRIPATYLDLTHPTDSTMYLQPLTGGGFDTTYTYTKYAELDYDQNYHFEGYQIFQLKNKDVSIADIYDVDKARLVIQCDVKNYYDSTAKTRPIGKLINYVRNNSSGALEPQVMVEGSNNGVSHTFSVTEDQFATSRDKSLVNNKVYYYVAIAYAQNEFKLYDPENPLYTDGQKEPYLAGRKREGGFAITPISVIPHDPISENGGTIMQSSYGMSPLITRIEGRGNGGIQLELTKESKDQILQLSPGESSYLAKPVYERNAGPVRVKVVDPLNLKEGSYYIKFQDTSATSHWVLRRTDNGPIFSDGTDSVISDVAIGSNGDQAYEQVFLDLGISIAIAKTQDVSTNGTPSGTGANFVPINGGNLIDGAMLSFSMHYADSLKAWLNRSGISDNDSYPPYDWIRSGNNLEPEAVRAKYETPGTCLPADSLVHVTSDYYTQNAGRDISLDATAMMEKIAWIAPYRLASNSNIHPAFSPIYYAASGANRRMLADPRRDVGLAYNRLSNLASVDIVLTNDQSKWTRCPVIEMGENENLTEGGAKRFQLRKALSVKKDGTSDGSGTMGMGWFPGYVINLETGERLNIFFGEDSRYNAQNGNDMKWNPTSVATDNTGALVLGGKHYIYILGSNTLTLRNNAGTGLRTITSPAYDEGEWAYEKLKSLDNLSVSNTNQISLYPIYDLFANVMWTGMPLLAERQSFKDPSQIPTDLTIKLRVRKSYLPNYTNRGDVSSAPQNKNNPMFMFEITGDLATLTNQAAVKGESFKNEMLDKIAVVPNPYYARSGYESSQLDARVRITNLPARTVVSIYSSDGTLVRRLNPSPADETTLDWDLKNQTGLPIAGGTYLVHLKVPGVGERVIRWFGAVAPIDLNSYE